MTVIGCIGFTGTIASGKTARCQRLVCSAVKRQLPNLTLSTAELVALASVHHGFTAAQAASSGTVRDHRKRIIQDLPVSVNYLNADLVAHHIYRPGTLCYTELIQHFGRRIVAPQNTDDSTSAAPIDRRVLGSLVFADPDQLRALNGICWPHIHRAITETFQACQESAVASHKRGQLFILEAALLVELLSATPTPTPTAAPDPQQPRTPTPLRSVLTDIWMTRCDAAVAVKRAVTRDGLSEDAARARLSQQKTATETAALMSSMGFVGDHFKVFDTTAVTLDQGLLQVDAALDAYWKRTFPSS